MAFLHLFAGGSIGNTEPVYSDEALALFARFDSEPTPLFKGAYDAFLTTTGVLAILAKLDGFYCVAAHDTQAATRNWCGDVYNLTLNGTFTHIPGLHLKGNGSNAWAATGANIQSLAGLTQNSVTLLAYFHEGATGGSIIGIDGADDRLRMAVGTTQVSYRINDATTQNTTHGSGGVGLHAAIRSASNARRVVVGDTTAGSSTNASSAPVDATINLYRNQSNYSANAAAFVAFGSALTNEECGILASAMSTFCETLKPRVVWILGVGQSNTARLDNDNASTGSGDGSAGSRVINTVIKPLVKQHMDDYFTDGRANIVNHLISSITEGGTFLLRQDAVTAPRASGYWVDNTDPPNFSTSALLNNWKSGVESGLPVPLPMNHTAIYLWNHSGQPSDAEAASGEWVDAIEWEKDFMDAVVGRTDTKFVHFPNGTLQGDDARRLAYRLAQGEHVANNAYAYLANESVDLQRIAANDPHPVSSGVSDQGFVLYGRRLAGLIAYAAGALNAIWRGPEAVSATAVDSTTIDVAVSYPAGCGGTDFTPSTGIVGFKVTDSGGAKTVSAAVRQNANTIRLTLSAALVDGNVEVRYEPWDTALAITSMVRDNYDPPFAMVHSVVNFNY